MVSKNVALSLAAVAALAVGAAHAAPVVLDFSTGTLANTGAASGGTTYDTYTQSGFTLKTTDSRDHVEGTLFGYSPAGTLSWHKTGSNPSTDNRLITDFAGAAFDLTGIDVLINPDGLSITSSKGGVFNYAAGSIGAISFAALGSDWQNITSFTIGIVGNANGMHRLDSIQLNNAPTTIPEPASLALVSLSLLAAGAAVRKSRKQA